MKGRGKEKKTKERSLSLQEKKKEKEKYIGQKEQRKIHRRRWLLTDVKCSAQDLVEMLKAHDTYSGQVVNGNTFHSSSKGNEEKGRKSGNKHRCLKRNTYVRDT